MSFRLLIANSFSALGPPTRLLEVRARLFRWAGVSLGTGVRIAQGVWMANAEVEVGAGTWIGPWVRLTAGNGAPITIGANCDIGPGALFVSGSHEIGPSSRRAGRGSSAPITIGAGTWVGARATLISGSSVGAGCVVAAGAVVKGRFQDNCLLAGVPAAEKKALEG